MFPTVLQIGPLAISFFGITTAIGFFFGSFLVWKKSKEEHFDQEKIMDMILLVTLIAFLAARTLYVFLHWSALGSNLLSWFDFVYKPGFSWYGAFLGGIMALKIFCQKQKWDFYQMADFSCFGLVLGTIFVSLGSGKLYELIFDLIILRLLYYFDREYRTYSWYKNKRGEAAPGFLFLVFLSLFSLGKLIVAFLNPYRLYWDWWQSVNLALAIISLIILYFRSGKSLKEVFLFWQKNLNKR